MLKWHVTPRSPYYEWVIHRHIGYTAPKHTKFHISNPLPPTTTKKPKNNSRPQRQTTRGDSFFCFTNPPSENHLRHGFPSRAAIAGRRLRVPRGRHHQPRHAHAALGAGAQVLAARLGENIWKKCGKIYDLKISAYDI